MIKYLSFHASKLLDIFAKITSDKFLTTGWVREARMSQFLTMRSKDVLFGTKETIDSHLKKEKMHCCIIFFFFGKMMQGKKYLVHF